MEEGSIILARSILNSKVFAHQTALKIWIWCLCRATYKERFVSFKIGKGNTTVKLLPGQFIFGRFKAEDELGIDGSTIYKWMQRFASVDYDMIKIESNNQYSIVSICNWGEYQPPNGKGVTSKEQPCNSQVTAKEQPRNTNNKDNKDNNIYKNIFLKVLEEEKIVLPEKFEELILEWLKYKSEKGQPYKKTGLKTLIKTFLRDSNSDYATARGMLDYSMSKNYSGLFKHSNNGSNQQSDKRSDKRINDYWD